MYLPEVILNDKSDSPEYAQMLKDINECENIATSLMSELSKIDSSIAQLQDNFFAAAEECMNVSSSLLDGIDENNIERHKGRAIAGLATGGVAIATAIGGLVVGAYKRHNAKKEYNKKMDALLEEKQLIADEKLDNTVKLLKGMKSGVFKKMEVLYENEFSKTVNCDDSLISLKSNLFKRSLGMVLKTRVLCSTMEYLVCEMRAWTNGKHNSEYVFCTAKEIFEEELDSWPSRFHAEDWTELMNNVIRSTQNTIPVPISFVLQDPAMLQTFGRVDLPLIDEEKYLSFVKNKFLPSLSQDDTDSLLPAIFECEYSEELTDEGKIHYTGTINVPDTSVKELIINNEYYKKCKNILNTKYTIPTKPGGFGIGDILVLALMAASVVGYYLLISNWLADHWFFRWVLYLLFPVAILGVWGYLVGENIEILPYKCRQVRYDNEMQEAINSITKELSDNTEKEIIL